jgi:hypothetical protein
MSCECGCGRPAAPGGLLSWACYKQRKRTGSTTRTSKTKTIRHTSPKEMLLEAVRNLAEADGIEGKEWDRAQSRFWMAVRRYMNRKANSVQRATQTPRRG